jgi:transcriptional regulator NrdR family protein
MILCPTCLAWTEVADSRSRPSDNTQRRRYVCANGHRFSTIESVQVLKQGGARKRKEPKP